MGVFGAHYDMNTFSLAERSLYPRFLCLQERTKKNTSLSFCKIMELRPWCTELTAASQQKQARPEFHQEIYQ